MRVQAALDAAGSPARVHELTESTRTSAEAAAALGVEVAQIAKTLVFLADGRAVIVVASGSDRVGTAALAQALGAGHIERPDADTVRRATGYPIGGVSPLGLPAGLDVVVDRGLEPHDPIWAAAGTPNAVYPTTFPELLRMTGGRVVDVRQAPEA